MNSRLKRIQLVRTVERRVDIMKVGVKFYSYLKGRFEDREREFELNNGSNIRDLLDLLCTSPEQRQAIFDQSGELSPFVRILKNERDIKVLDGLQTKLEDRDSIALFPPMGGGG